MAQKTAGNTMPNDICFSSARQLAAQIAARKVSAREVMQAHLARISRVNPRLNAIVAKLDDDKCLALADAADHGGPAGLRRLGVKGALSSCQSLDDEPCVAVEKDRHLLLPLCQRHDPVRGLAHRICRREVEKIGRAHV